MTKRLLSGSCLCGAVRYEVPDAFEYAAICHCSRCRRATGAANKPFGGIARGALTVTAGADNVFRYGDESETHDIHCCRCGSLLYSVVREGMWLHISLGTLVNEPTMRPDHHIMVASKADWEVMPDDGLPRYAAFAT